MVERFGFDAEQLRNEFELQAFESRLEPDADPAVSWWIDMLRFRQCEGTSRSLDAYGRLPTRWAVTGKRSNASIDVADIARVTLNFGSRFKQSVWLPVRRPCFGHPRPDWREAVVRRSAPSRRSKVSGSARTPRGATVLGVSGPCGPSCVYKVKARFARCRHQLTN
jgi:hypothetical protein